MIPIRVVVVDDSAEVRDRLVAMLSAIPGVDIIAQAGSPSDAVNSIRSLEPDAVVLDIRLTGGSGIEVLGTVKKENPGIMVIILTNYPYPQYRERCRKIGADYFFDKSSEFWRVFEVLRDMTLDIKTRSR